MVSNCLFVLLSRSRWHGGVRLFGKEAEGLCCSHGLGAETLLARINRIVLKCEKQSAVERQKGLL